jgi:hypothetical protein
MQLFTLPVLYRIMFIHSSKQIDSCAEHNTYANLLTKGFNNSSKNKHNKALPMFRKIVSNLNFSPALVGQLGFYARRLKKEELTRRVGLVFTALALVVQFFAVFSPPEAANAASPADFVQGGVSSITQYLKYYDQNSNNIKDIFSSLGIKRSEIKDANLTNITAPGHYNWSMTSLYSYAQGQRAWSYAKSGGGQGTAYYRPMELTQEGGPQYPVFVGHSAAFGWFAIKKDCGNLITKIPPSAPNPQAICKNLQIQQIAPTRFRFVGSAGSSDGAVIKAYEYQVNHRGVIFDKKFDSNQPTHTMVYDQATPGTYNVTLTVHSSEGPKTGPNCQDSFVVSDKPAAECVEANAEIINRTTVSLSGKATTSNGATIHRYVFVVNDANGNQVKKIVIDSAKKQVTADSFSLSQGNYTVHLTVKTSLGEKTSPQCVKAFSIAPTQVCQYNPTLPPNSPDCQPCPDNPNIWIKDEKCSTELINTKTATNMSEGNVVASTVIAKAGDKISYTITTENRGFNPKNITFKENLADVLDYAELIDLGGGSFDSSSKVLSWPQVQLAAGARQSRTIVARVLTPVPTTNTGTSNQDSFDCKMVNTFGNAVSINVKCDTSKIVVEQVEKELPHTGPRENMIFAGVLLAVVVYFYARSRQLGKEVRLIRRNLNTGTV